jgi:putative DNA methylase
MTRMIERWFPCAEVSLASGAGWGSGNTESSLWVWFAKRPVAQSKAAVLTSLLPWPQDSDEQERLMALVRDALTGYRKAQREIAEVLTQEYGTAPKVLDPFSGRGMIPLEAGRLDCAAFGVDYSPLAALGGQLLADLIHRDWSNEPELPLSDPSMTLAEPRLVSDTRAFLHDVGLRQQLSLSAYYPTHGGKYPWGYFWASTLPCQECGRRFPLVGELHLRLPREKKQDKGQSFYLDADKSTGLVRAVVHDGPPIGQPTRVLAGKSKFSSSGRVAVCPFCSHVHSKAVHTRLSAEGMREDLLLVAADIADDGNKVFREPTADEFAGAETARLALVGEEPFGDIPARPDEAIPPGNSWTIQAVNYGDSTYGDLMEPRQTLNLVHLARAINEVSRECLESGASAEYVRTLAGLATAAMMRKIRRSTRGARLQKAGGCQVGDLFVNQSAVSFSYDWFESGMSDGPGSWASLADQTVAAVRNITTRGPAKPATIEQGDATSLRFRTATFNAVVTDPPYDDMIDYSDSSDLFFVWAKRAMAVAAPDFAITGHPDGLQSKEREAIVKRGGSTAHASDHRTRSHYDSLISAAFAESCRVVDKDGVVTIVFGHGDPEVWQRLLSAISAANLVLTGSWPAKTEAGSGAAASNIVTTLTMSCRPAPPVRPSGRKGTIEAEIKAEIKQRYPDWERWGMAPADMLMAAAGPAMEVVGRYSEVLDAKGDPVDIYTFLPLARAAVQMAMAVEIDRHPLDTFDARTRFALWWMRLYGRQVQPKSELRWQALASSLDLTDVRDLVPDADKGVRFTSSKAKERRIGLESAVIDVALALAAASGDGLDAMGDVLATSGRPVDDAYLWAAVKFMADRLPDSDPDGIAFTRVLRTRQGIANATHTALVNEQQDLQRQLQKGDDAQLRLL